MLRVTRRAEYGLMALSYMARRPKDFCSGREIADRLSIPKRLLAEILKDLSQAQWVEATRGPGGGYRLLHQASEIPLAEVLQRLEGPVLFTECHLLPGETLDLHEEPCPFDNGCVIQKGMRKVAVEIWQVLQRFTLADLIGEEVPRRVSV